MPLADTPPAEPQPTESAVIVAIPEAEPVVARHRERFDVAASWGVPAHVTILYPFVEPVALTDDTCDRLRFAIFEVERFRCEFRRTGWFDRDAVWLDPEPVEPFQRLTRAVVGQFPDHLPYGGAFGTESRPHLTIAESRLATDRQMMRAEVEVLAALPFNATVTEALLIVGTSRSDSWGVFARLPLGG